ncbi:Gfo/Idh/MocA family protein [Priestia megaterium]
MESGAVKMKVGVIGTGSMGEKHVRTYTSLSDYCQLIGIYDSDEKRGAAIALKYQVKLFKSIDDLLRAVDAVSIVVPTEYHYEIGLACIKNRVHMLMEKPMTSNVKQAELLNEKAKESGIKLQVGHIELYNPVINVLRSMVAQEEIIALDIHRMSPYDPRLSKVDVIQDLMIHDIYILKELLNDEIINFYTFGQTTEGKSKHAVAILKSTRGIIAQMTASFKSMEKIRTIHVLTEEQVIKANLLDSTIEVIKSPNSESEQRTSDYEEKITKVINIPQQEPLKLQLIDFLNCIKNNKEPLVNGESGIDVLDICNKISELANHIPR